jgi:hypothetical protein
MKISDIEQQVIIRVIEAEKEVIILRIMTSSST